MREPPTGTLYMPGGGGRTAETLVLAEPQRSRIDPAFSFDLNGYRGYGPE